MESTATMSKAHYSFSILWRFSFCRSARNNFYSRWERNIIYNCRVSIINQAVTTHRRWKRYHDNKITETECIPNFHKISVRTARSWWKRTFTSLEWPVISKYDFNFSLHTNSKLFKTKTMLEAVKWAYVSQKSSKV